MVQGQTKVVFNDVLNPEELYIDGEHIYIAEEGVIKAFSLSDGKKLYQLTSKGEGPFEFKFSPGLTFLPEYIVATGDGKVVFYQRDGKKLLEKKVPANLRMFPVKDNYICDRYLMDNKLQRFVTKSYIYNADFREIILLNTAVEESSVIINSKGNSSKQNYYIIPHGSSVITDGNNICLYDSKKGFFIEIFDHNGKKISSINKDYKKVNVSTVYKDQKMDALKKNSNWGNLKRMFNFVFPDYFPAFRLVYMDNGLLCILTDTPNEEVQTLVAMDFTGKKLTSATAPNLTYRYFYKGRLFYFKENKDEKWVLHIQKLL